MINEYLNNIENILSYKKIKYAPESKYPEILSNWFYENTNEKLNLDKPKTFNEKIQWLKLYDSTPLKTKLTDKYQVRDWVKEKIGEQYLIPILGVYDNFDEIDFDILPNRFVIKTNHGCGFNIIIKNKDLIIKEQIKYMIEYYLSINYAFWSGLELQYKDIIPKIIIEQYIEDENGQLNDYKIICFNSEPKYIWIDTERQTNHKRNIYDLNWNLLPVALGYPNDEQIIKPPENLSEMIRIAKILCKDFYHVRVDLYSIKNNIYFGELTFTSGSGIEKFTPKSCDLIWGDLININLN